MTAPGAPTSVVAAAGETAVVLAWTAPDDGGSAITGYRVTPRIGDVAQAPILTGSALPAFVVTGLGDGSDYTFTVAAINGIGTGPESSASMPATPGAVAAIRPTVDEVAALERTRTVTAGGNEVGTFNDQTRPTAEEADNLIDFAVTMVLGQPAYLRSKAIVTLLAALLIEESYFRDDAAVARFRDLLMRLGFVIPIGGAGGGPVNARQVDSVVMRSTMADYDPVYAKPVSVPDWPYEGANPVEVA